MYDVLLDKKQTDCSKFFKLLNFENDNWYAIFVTSLKLLSFEIYAREKYEKNAQFSLFGKKDDIILFEIIEIDATSTWQ